MKFVAVLFIAFLLLIIGGFAFVAMTDVPVPQSEVTKTLKLSDLPTAQ